MTRAVLYCRVSTDAQTDNTSLAAQYLACLKKAEELGCEIGAHFEETESGSLYLARPMLQRALAMIEAREADTLIIYRLDRTGRDVDGLRAIRKRVRDAGGALVFADGMQFDRTPTGNLMFTQLGAFAEFERETIRDRTMRGLRAMAQNGKQPSRNWPAFGYHIVTKADVLRGTHPTGSEGTYVVRDDQAAVVRVIFEQYLSGHSLRSLCGWLIENGYPSPQGRTWTAASVRAILSRPHYKGTGTYGARRHRIDEARLASGKRIRYSVKSSAEDVVTFPVPPIVDADVWQRANERLATGNAQRSGPPSKYPLTGLVYCPACGRRMYAMKVPDAHAFGCSAAWPVQIGQSARCDRRRYSGPLLESLVTRALVELLQTPDAVEKAARDYERAAKVRAKTQRTDDDIKRLTGECERLARREQTAADAAIEARLNGSDGAAYERARQDAETRRRSIEQQVIALQASKAASAAPVWQLSAPADVLIDALQANGDRSELWRSLILRAYPIPITVSTDRRNYHTAGVTLILRTETATMTVVRFQILSRSGSRVENTRLSVSVELEPPYPLPPPDGRRKNTETV